MSSSRGERERLRKTLKARSGEAEALGKKIPAHLGAHTVFRKHTAGKVVCPGQVIGAPVAISYLRKI